MTVVISHQACDQGWKIPPKCLRNTQEEFHQAHPAFCPLSGDSGHFQGLHHLLITPFQASALTTIFMVAANELLSSTPRWQQTWKENESALPLPGVPHPCPPTNAPDNSHSLPSGRAGGLCSAHRGTEQMPYRNHCTELLEKVLHSYMQAAGLLLTP